MEIKIRDGILIGKYPDGLSVTLPIAKELVAERLKFQKGKAYPILIYVNGMSFASFEAREYMVGSEGIAKIKAGAFIINSAVESIILNLFFVINKPGVPTRMFPEGKEDEAIKWLQHYK